MSKKEINITLEILNFRDTVQIRFWQVVEEGV
jgi:hypothetical protein